MKAMKRILYLIPIFMLFLSSCHVQKQIVEVPVETVKIEYVHGTKVDSVCVRDSIDRYIKGDSVFIYKEHTKYKYVNKTDTVVRVDSIPKIVKVETVKEVKVNHIKWYQKVLMWAGGIFSLIFAGGILYKIKLK